MAAQHLCLVPSPSGISSFVVSISMYVPADNIVPLSSIIKTTTAPSLFGSPATTNNRAR